MEGLRFAIWLHVPSMKLLTITIFILAEAWSDLDTELQAHPHSMNNSSCFILGLSSYLFVEQSGRCSSPLLEQDQKASLDVSAETKSQELNKLDLMRRDPFFLYASLELKKSGMATSCYLLGTTTCAVTLA